MKWLKLLEGVCEEELLPHTGHHKDFADACVAFRNYHKYLVFSRWIRLPVASVSCARHAMCGWLLRKYMAQVTKR